MTVSKLLSLKPPNDSLIDPANQWESSEIAGVMTDVQLLFRQSPTGMDI